MKEGESGRGTKGVKERWRMRESEEHAKGEREREGGREKV